MEHKKAAEKIGKAAPFLLIFAVITAASVSGGMILSFDREVGHFAYNSTWLYVIGASLALSAIVSGILGLISKNKFSFAEFPETTWLSWFASFLGGIMAIIYAVRLAECYRTGSSPLSLLSGILFAALAISLILGCFRRRSTSLFRAVFSILAALSVIASMFACYFDFTLPINSPVRHLITVDQAGVVLMLLQESRFAIAPEKRATSGFFAFSTAFASSAVLGISSGLVIFTLAAQGDYGFTLSPFQFSCYAAIGLLALARLLTFGKTIKEYIPQKTDQKSDANAGESTADGDDNGGNDSNA